MVSSGIRAHGRHEIRAPGPSGKAADQLPARHIGLNSAHAAARGIHDLDALDALMRQHALEQICLHLRWLDNEHRVRSTRRWS